MAAPERARDPVVVSMDLDYFFVLSVVTYVVEHKENFSLSR